MKGKPIQAQPSQQKIWSIKGGVHPVFNKACSTQQPVSIPTVPATLVIPVVQHIGEVGHILVAQGQQVYKGQPLVDMPEGLGAITHAPTSGIVQIVEERAVPHVSGLTAICVVIDTDGKEEWGDYQQSSYSGYQSIDTMTLCKRLHTAGLVGMGGAAFPSAAKFAASRKRNHGLDTLIINGAECEPYISCDDMLMRGWAEEIVEGIHILLHILNPKRCLVGIEDNKPEAIAAMQQALDKRKKSGITIVKIPTIYPSGDEKQLIRILTGKALAKQELPFQHGILVQNVATVHSVYNAIIKGQPLISRILTVTGRGIKKPQNFQALIGTSFQHLIEQAGGYTDYVERLIMGGPMMGYSMKTDELPVIKATNCILALPKEDLPYSPDMAMPCIRCGKCMDACPVDLLPQQLFWHAKAKEFDKIQDYKLNDCIECGCCSYVCPSKIPLVSYYRYAKSEIREENKKQQEVDLARERFEFRELRLERAKAERDAKRAAHKAALQKKKTAVNKDPKQASSKDDKQDVIKAALERAKLKQEQRKAKPRNTNSLTEAQQKQIDEIDQRRAKEVLVSKSPEDNSKEAP
ncbi:MAG: electron transport complex subunit RsxC [Thiotrichaceae bacterium]